MLDVLGSHRWRVANACSYRQRAARAGSHDLQTRALDRNQTPLHTCSVLHPWLMARARAKSKRGNWAFVASPDAEVELGSVVPAALSAAPPEVASGGRLLPRRNTNGLCRICGEREATTREHVPPRAAGNDRTGRSHTLDEWLARDDLGTIPGGLVEQGGIFGLTLCDGCNRRSGRYAGEYRDWAATSSRLITEVPNSPVELDQLPSLHVVGVRLGPDVRPGAFARQVLASMCSAAGPWDVAARNPEIRDMVLRDGVGRLPSPLSLSMGLFLGPHAFIAGPSLQVNLPTNEWRWIAVIAYPPFAFELILEKAWDQLDPLCGIDNFFEVDPATRGTVEL